MRVNERLNLLCIGDRLLDPTEHRSSIEAIAASLSGGQFRLLEALRIDSEASSETVVAWADAEELAAAPLPPGALLIAYFAMPEAPDSRQSVTFDVRLRSSLVSVSLAPQVALADPGASMRALHQLAGWAQETFENAVLAVGPELDLYEVPEAAGLPEAEVALSTDWRCWATIHARRFPDRVAAITRAANVQRARD